MNVEDYRPKALKENTIVSGNARFTVLTDKLLRIEYASNAQFEDRASLAAVNRALPKVRFKVTETDEALTLDTNALCLTYQKGKHKGFTASNLTVTFKQPVTDATWAFGKDASGNLKGTARTLDNYDADDKRLLKEGENPKLQLDNGVASRDGWAVIDDSGMPVLDKQGKNSWIASRPQTHKTDLYLFAYGKDFKAAVSDAAKVFGKQPLPPRYTLGYWYSRYWQYTDREIRDIVSQFNRLQVPLDVFVVDMDWHLLGWTGYTWDKSLFPDPAAFLKHLKDESLKITLNLHPADGVKPHEEAFEKVCRAMGKNPKRTKQIPFDCTDSTFMKAYFKYLHHPHEDIGVDFWWMDWQQGKKTKVNNLDPLPWLNHTHWQDKANRDESTRPVCFSRYGGIGAGRYPVGFSGDTYCTWKSLSYQPYFTATAANVLYGYWSHDIGGHQPGDIDGELYTRWMQYGIFSPILRTHCGKNAVAERRFWEFPSPYNTLLIDTVRQRYRMIPYIYSECRRATDTGLSLIYPLYYEWPDEQQAYQETNAYYFGSEMIAAPVTQPLGKNHAADVSLWLPPGKWIDTARGCQIEGGKKHKASYLIDEIPTFVRPGAIIPEQGETTRIKPGSYPSLNFRLYPAPGVEHSYTVYEDDGVSNDYLKNKAARWTISMKAKKKQVSVTLHPAKGRFKGFEKERPVTLTLCNSLPPKAAKLGRKGLNEWSYDGNCAELTLSLGTVDITQEQTVLIDFTQAIDSPELDGWKGLMNRLNQVQKQSNSASYFFEVHKDERFPAWIAQSGQRIESQPTKALATMRECWSSLDKLERVLDEHHVAYQKLPSKYTCTQQIASCAEAKKYFATIAR